MMPATDRTRGVLWRRTRPSARLRPPETESPAPATPADVLVFASWLALAGGLLVLAAEVLRRALLGESAWLGHDQWGRHSLWMVPASVWVVMAPVGVFWAAVLRVRTRRPLRLPLGVLVFLAAWSLLLTVRGLHPLAGALLAAGVAMRLTPSDVGATQPWLRIARRSHGGLALAALGLAAFAFAADALRERRHLAGAPSAPCDAPNVLLIVLDAARADALTPYGARRDTTPCLAKLARRGVRFENARATAPWTLSSHASFFTGRWPRELRTGDMKPLDATYPTLAEFLHGKGYATAGFVGNYFFGGSPYGLDRGFGHYEDRAVTLDDVLGATGLGRQVYPWFDALRGMFVGRGTADLQYVTHRKTAEEINRSFLRWVDRKQGRPFFAFLNYIDVHAPYIPPGPPQHPFGQTPRSSADFAMLREWETRREQERKDGKTAISARDFALARDGYDDCLNSLDREVGRLLLELKRRGLLDNTVVVVTADHGEEFGEHGLFGHFISLHRAELDVPLLVMFPPRVPAGRTVSEPVSLRDLPATILDLVGWREASPFPGRSLASLWDDAPDERARRSPAYSEMPELGLRAIRSGTQVYIHHDNGFEQLFDLKDDPGEDRNLAGSPAHAPALSSFRATLAGLETEEARGRTARR